MPEWLWQAIFANWIWELLVLAVGIVFGWLRHRNVSWLPVLFYGLAASTCVAVLVYTFIGRAIISRQDPETTSENIESNIKAWADKFSLGIQKQTDDKYDFVYAVSLPSGRSVLVGRPKGREGYLNFQGNMALGPEHIEFLKKISPAQLERISDEINIEMARNKTGFSIMAAPFQGIAVSKGVPITVNLTQDSFIAYLNEIDSSMLLAREAIRIAFFHNGMTTPAVMLHPQS